MSLVESFPAWKQAVGEFLRLNPQSGHLLTKQWLADQFKLTKPITAEDLHQFQMDFMSCFEAFRKELLEEHRMAFKTVHGAGYQLLAPNEQTSWALKEGVKSISKEFRKLENNITFVNVSALSESERKENTDAVARISSLKQNLNRRKILGRIS